MTNEGGAGDEERDAMQLWFEARWARLVAQRRAREESSREEPAARRLARLERRLTRPLSGNYATYNRRSCAPRVQDA